MSAVSAGRSARLLGAGTANLSRLTLAAVFLAFWAHTWGQGLTSAGLPWLLRSRLNGFGLGDMALYGAYHRLGPRLALLLCPCLAAPIGAVVPEIWEESGFEAKVLKLAAVWDRSKHPHRPFMPFHIYKLFFLCEITGGAAAESHETTGVGFFAENEPPTNSPSRERCPSSSPGCSSTTATEPCPRISTDAPSIDDAGTALPDRRSEDRPRRERECRREREEHL